ncbi:hypothetical protein Esti_006163 [Eimeria stiedai]
MNVPSLLAHSELGSETARLAYLSGEANELDHSQLAASRFRRRSVFKTTASVALLSGLAFLFAMVTCFSKFGRISGERSRIEGRRLAGGEQEEDGDKSFSALLSACLDLQAEIGYQADDVSLLNEEEAIRQIVADLEGYQETVVAVDGVKSPSSPPVSTEAPSNAQFQQYTLDELPSSGLTHVEDIAQPTSALEQVDLSSILERSFLHAESLSLTAAVEGESQMAAPLFPESLASLEKQESVPKGARRKRTSWEAGFSDSAAQPTRQEVSSSGSSESLSQRFATEPLFREDIVTGATAAAALQEEPESQDTEPPLFREYIFTGATAAAALQEEPESKNTQTSLASDDSLADVLQSRAMGIHNESRNVLTGFVEEFLLIPFDSSNSETSSEQSSSASPTTSPSDHPDYRVPFVDRQAIRRTFNMTLAFQEKSYKRLLPTMRHMRALLAQRTLSGEQAEQLIMDSEQIVAFLVQTQKEKVVGKPLCIAMKALGRRYLTMDAIACSIQAIGPPMLARLWWSQLAAMIPSEYPLRDTVASPKRHHRAAVVSRLTSALELLKQGIRPSAEETVGDSHGSDDAQA